jgi:hypothetical protein
MNIGGTSRPPETFYEYLTDQDLGMAEHSRQNKSSLKNRGKNEELEMAPFSIGYKLPSVDAFNSTMDLNKGNDKNDKSSISARMNKTFEAVNSKIVKNKDEKYGLVINNKQIDLSETIKKLRLIKDSKTKSE